MQKVLVVLAALTFAQATGDVEIYHNYLKDDKAILEGTLPCDKIIKTIEVNGEAGVDLGQQNLTLTAMLVNVDSKLKDRLQELHKSLLSLKSVEEPCALLLGIRAIGFNKDMSTDVAPRLSYPEIESLKKNTRIPCSSVIEKLLAPSNYKTVILVDSRFNGCISTIVELDDDHLEWTKYENAYTPFALETEELTLKVNIKNLENKNGNIHLPLLLNSKRLWN